MSRLLFMNTEIDNLTMDEAVATIDELIQKGEPSFVVTPNVDHIVQLEAKGPLYEAYKSADLILCDGKPLVWISKWYGTPIKEKVSGADLFPRLCELSAQKGYRMFFLGAAEGVAVRASANMKALYPNLQVAGCYSPPMGFENDEAELTKIKELIRDAHPQLLIVALGCPKQELFIQRYKQELAVPVSLGLGASIDFAAGIVKRCPKWMADIGLEWIYRTVQDPKRLFKRYFINDRKIVPLIIKYRPKHKH